MLPPSTTPRSFQALPDEFRPCFTNPTFPTFSSLVTGPISQTRRRTVCGMPLGAGLERAWHHSKAHRFFSAARWSTDRIGLLLADLIIRLLPPEDSPIALVVDDTLSKRSGKKVFGAFWHHDGAAKGPKPIGYGNCRVVAGTTADPPFLSRPVCPPVLARLWTPKGTGKITHARAMAERLATRYPNRTIHVVGDAAYISEHLREPSENITWTSRPTTTPVLHEPPPEHTGKVGKPKTKGARPGTPEDMIARYAPRRSIEPVFFNARRILGVGEAHNRLRNAVERTIPLGQITYTLTTLWHSQNSHDPQQITDERSRRRWYTTKTEPSSEDMTIKHRRVITAAQFQHPGPHQPQPEQTRAIPLTWAAAET